MSYDVSYAVLAEVPKCEEERVEAFRRDKLEPEGWAWCLSQPFARDGINVLYTLACPEASGLTRSRFDPVAQAFVNLVKAWPDSTITALEYGHDMQTVALTYYKDYKTEWVGEHGVFSALLEPGRIADATVGFSYEPYERRIDA